MFFGNSKMVVFYIEIIMKINTFKKVFNAVTVLPKDLVLTACVRIFYRVYVDIILDMQ